MPDPLRDALDEAEEKAWNSLGRYKFHGFGYWAGVWVHLNRIGGFREPNPFKDLVATARLHKREAKSHVDAFGPGGPGSP